jgi:HD-like signal output (HDOD) protein
MSPIETNSLHQRIESAASRLPSSARIFERLNDALRNPDVDVEEIIDIIRTDPAVALRVMRLANSAQFVRGKPFSNLESAVDWIGITHLYQLLAATVSAKLFCDFLPTYGLASESIWKNSVATATAMSLLAEAAGQEKRQAYSIGLFRPVGRLVLEQISEGGNRGLDLSRLPKSETVLAWERSCFGMDNAEAVSVIFHKWGMKPSLGESIRIHFDPFSSPDSPEVASAALLYIASWMAQQAGHGLSIEAGAWNPSPEMLELACLPPFKLDPYITLTREITARLTVNPGGN